MGIVMGIVMGIERVLRMGIAYGYRASIAHGYRNGYAKIARVVPTGGEPSVGNAWVSPQIFVENIRGVYLVTVNTHQNHARLSLDDS